MRPLLRTALASLGCAVLAACADEPTSAPTISTPLRPNLAVDPPPVLISTTVITPCDINALRTDARLFADRSNDVLLTIIGDLGSAVRNGLSSAGNDKAFDGLARMAAIRGTSAQKPGVTGQVFDRLVHRFLGCMQPTVYAGVLEPTPPTTTGGPGFRQALGPGWVFEVRGKAGDPTTGAYERGATSPANWWAIEPVPGTLWADAVVGGAPMPDRVLIFGYRTSFIEAVGRAGSSFEHRTLPDVSAQFTLTVNVGLCFAAAADVNPSSQRVNHANKFLPLAEAANCNGFVAPQAITPTTGSLAFRGLNPMKLAKRAASFIWPQSLYASTAFFDGGSITGRPDDFSPSAVYDLSQITLRFDTIANGFINTPLQNNHGDPVRVWALSPDNVPIPGVDVVVTIAGNSGTGAKFNGGQTSVTATGTPAGYAVLTGVSLDKAGGHTLAAKVNVAGVIGTTEFLSNLFNIQNKTTP